MACPSAERAEDIDRTQIPNPNPQIPSPALLLVPIHASHGAMDPLDFAFFFLGGSYILLALEMGRFALELGIAGEPGFVDSGVRHCAARFTLMSAISKTALKS